jgi:hypothetical protein
MRGLHDNGAGIIRASFPLAAACLRRWRGGPKRPRFMPAPVPAQAASSAPPPPDSLPHPLPATPAASLLLASAAQRLLWALLACAGLWGLLAWAVSPVQ